MSVVRQLHQLQIVDIEWDGKNFRLEEVNESLGETDDLVQSREAVVVTEAELKQVRSQARAMELDVATVAAKLKKNQDRLYSGKVRNPKELSNLQEEAAALRRRQAELEDNQLELMIEVEEQEAELAERQARRQQIETNWHDNQAALQAEKEELEFRLLELEEDQGEKRTQIGAANLLTYDDFRDRYGGMAVVILKRGICQTCGVDVPTGVARAVERGEGMHYCPVCSRILFGG